MTMNPAPAPGEGRGEPFAGRVVRVVRVVRAETKRGDVCACVVCGRSFTCAYNRQVTCSPECHKARTKKTRTGYLRSVKGRRTTRAWRKVARKLPKYREAANRAQRLRRARRPAPPFRIERHCRQCGRAFTITDPLRANSLYCRAKCRQAWRLAYFKARRAAETDTGRAVG